MSSPLFDDFPPVSSKQWKQKIQFDLKGADYNENLIWKSPEGIAIKPFYHSDEIKAPFVEIPGHPQNWNIGQCIYIDDEAVAGRLAATAVNRGAEAVYFTSEKPFDVDKLFMELNNGALYYFDLKFLGSEFCKHSAFSQENVIVFHDIIHHHAQEGNWHQTLKEDFNSLGNCIKYTHTLAIDCALYQNAGATIVQQLAYALAHANEYFNAFEGQMSSKTQVLFRVAVGSNYFFEIAKIRALRLLYSTLAKEYALSKNCHIIATPSKRNKTLYDYNVNMLRTTTECMSAVLGGADTVCNLPYDGIYHKSNEFGERISRNQLLILKHESYFDTERNPAEGTLYIETLTLQLAEKALEVFKEIEAGGGFLNQLKEGTIQKKIKESASKEQGDFDRGEKTLLGTNKYPNPNDRMKNELELYPFVKTKPRKTLIEPIIEKRLAEKTEQERLENE